MKIPRGRPRRGEDFYCIGMGPGVNYMAQDGVAAPLPLTRGLSLLSVSILKEHGIYTAVRGKGSESCFTI